jgi:hypothetical protein
VGGVSGSGRESCGGDLLVCLFGWLGGWERDDLLVCSVGWLFWLGTGFIDGMGLARSKPEEPTRGPN